MANTVEMLEIDDESPSLDKQYLTFWIGEEGYAVQLEYVFDIVQMQTITPVPCVPAYVKGLINLRGTIIPVVDMRVRFNKPERPYDERTTIIVLKLDDVDLGLIVDQVQEVVMDEQLEIAAPPKNMTNSEQQYIIGLAQIAGVYKILIDCPKLFKLDELESGDFITVL